MEAHDHAREKEAVTTIDTDCTVERGLATIAIPTYNGAVTLLNAVGSALRQDYSNLEVIVLDNASTDETAALVDAVGRLDSRVVLVRHPTNLGPGANFTEGLVRARGTYFMWLAADDTISPNYLSACITRLVDGDHALVSGVGYLVEPNGELVDGPLPAYSGTDSDPQRRILRYLASVGQNETFYGVVKTDVARRCLPLPATVGGDWMWICKILLRATTDVAPSASFRKTTGGVSRDMRQISRSFNLGPIVSLAPRLLLFPREMFALIYREERTALRVGRLTAARSATHSTAVATVTINPFSDLPQIIGHPMRHYLRARLTPTQYERWKHAYKPVHHASATIRNALHRAIV